jgi:hypothetical protein
MTNVYKRNCPKCKDIIEYKNPRSFKWADRDKKPCRKCYSKQISETLKKKVEDGTYVVNKRPKNSEVKYTHFRNCPNCNEQMSYSRKDIRDGSEKRKTICNSCSAKVYKKTFNDVISEEHIKQMRATKAGFKDWEEYVEKYPKKQFYKREVWRYTYKNPLNELEHWEKRGRCGVDGAYQLDHIQSINWGWENGIPAQQIADWNNLRMIPWKENRDKW